jgi:hypothetical protein
VAPRHRGDAGHPEVQQDLLNIPAVYKDAGVPCAVGTTATTVPTRLEQGFRIITTPPEKTTEGLSEGRRLAGR